MKCSTSLSGFLVRSTAARMPLLQSHVQAGLGRHCSVKLLACATQGSGGDDEVRLRALVSAFRATFVEFTKRHKWASAFRLLGQLRSRQFDLFVLEGSGIAGGLPAIAGRMLWGMPYVVSSGDAVAPFLSSRHPIGKPLFSWYERTLCAHASGFIGWTPYLVGRALTYGTPRAITIPGWAPFTPDKAAMRNARRAIRSRFNIPESAVIFGLVGSLNWSQRYEYCYGLELVKAARLANGAAYVLILGDGSGLEHLRGFAGDALGSTILLPGRIARDEVPAYLAAMDMGSIPQSVDGVGSFRYTTKLAEYKAAGLPFVANQIPMAYDLDDAAIWRLPGTSPWDPAFIHALSDLMKSLTQSEIAQRLQGDTNDTEFDKQKQVDRATAFLKDLQ
jgi:Glycosyl transferase 4-like domain/Glycosyl transferases group 1